MQKDTSRKLPLKGLAFSLNQSVFVNELFTRHSKARLVVIKQRAFCLVSLKENIGTQGM